mmetsp:Transcript_24653/g.47301  ORF Transcript_24653/g.47301 Transcript_24653/m.47301 type:complete len:134 (-) Transcript_24653:600-1001(-)
MSVLKDAEGSVRNSCLTFVTLESIREDITSLELILDLPVEALTVDVNLSWEPAAPSTPGKKLGLTRGRVSPSDLRFKAIFVSKAGTPRSIELSELRRLFQTKLGQSGGLEASIERLLSNTWFGSLLESIRLLV